MTDYPASWQGVGTIDHQVRSGHIRRGITSKEHISLEVISWAFLYGELLGPYPFQFVRIAQSLGRDHAKPFVAPLLRMNRQHISCNKARRYTIDSAEM